MTMQTTNIDKIRAANEKLLRLDPEYRIGRDRNKRAAAKRNRMIYPCDVRVPNMNGVTPADEFDASEGALIAGYEEDLDRLARRDGSRNDVSNPSRSQMAATDGGKHPWRTYRPAPSLAKKDKPAKPKADKRPHLCRQGGGGPKAKVYTHAGETMTLAAWAEKLDMNLGTLRNRLTQGWTLEAALTIAPGTLMGEKTHRGRSQTSMKLLRTSGDQSRDTEPKQAFFLAPTS